MGDFDDVLAMEPGDEWDDYDPSTHSGPAASQLPVVAELQAPSACIVLRGEVPEELVSALASLTCRPEVIAADRVVVETELVCLGEDTASDGTPRWALFDREQGEQGPASTVAELADHLARRLVELARRADARQLLLPAGAVRLADGRGVLVVEPDRVRRHGLVQSLVELGAGHLGGDHVVAVPGSRTVLALPTPLEGGGPAPDQVAPMAVIDLVVVLEAADAEAATVAATEPLGRAHGLAVLLAAASSELDDATDAVGVLATLCGGADVWCVPWHGPARAASDILALPGPSPRELVTWRHPRRGVDELVVLRSAHGGVAADLASHAVCELDVSELPLIDSLGWLAGPEPGALDALLAQLAEAGVDLRPVRTEPAPPWVGPESYGLPDAPTGFAAASMWTVDALDRSRVDPSTLASLMVSAARRGDVDLDEATLEKLSVTAGETDQRRRATLELLDEVLAEFEQSGIDPLVIGSVVLALDGPVPPDLVEVDSIELLVAAGDLTGAAATVARLEGASVSVSPHDAVQDREPADLTSSEPTGPPQQSHVLAHVPRGGVDVPVGVRDRLAAGPFGELVDHDDLLDRAVPIRVGGRWVRALHPDDRVVHACIDASDPAGPSARAMRHLVLSAPASRRGMAAVLEASSRWGATQQVLEAVRLTDAALPGLSHWLVERATRPAPAPQRRRRRGLRRR